MTAAVPCLGLEANPTEERCRARHQECCTLIKHNGVMKCFRKRTQPNSGIHRNITRVFLCVLVSLCAVIFLVSVKVLEIPLFTGCSGWDFCKDTLIRPLNLIGKVFVTLNRLKLAKRREEQNFGVSATRKKVRWFTIRRKGLTRLSHARDIC